MKLKYSAFLCFLLCTVLFISSCGEQRSQGLEDFEEILLSTEKDTEKPFAELLYLIIPQGCSAELTKKAQELAYKISEKTGVRTVVKYDGDDIAGGADTAELLVGYGERLISREAMDGLREGESICRYDRGSIVLGGKDDGATIEAIERFERDILVGASYSCLMNEYAHFEILNEQTETEEFHYYLNEYPINVYGIVYNCKEAEKIAERLKKGIAEKCGYVLEISSSEEEKDGFDRVIELCIDEDCEERNAFVSPIDNGVRLHARNSVGLSLAEARFEEMLLHNLNTDGNSSVTVTADRIFDYGREKLSLSYCRIRVESKLDLELANNVSQTVLKFGGDVMLLDITDPKVLRYVEMSINENSGCAWTENKDGRVFCAIYNKAVCEIVNLSIKEGTAILCFTANQKQWKMFAPVAADNAELEKLTDERFVIVSDKSLSAENAEFIGSGEGSDQSSLYFYSDINRIPDGRLTVTEKGSGENTVTVFEVSLLQKYHFDFLSLSEQTFK